MTTSFIQKERQRIFRDLTRQYQQEGYVQDMWGEIDE